MWSCHQAALRLNISGYDEGRSPCCRTGCPPLSTRWAEPVPEAIREGERNTTLASLAGSLRYRGLDAETIAEALLVVNQRRCRPPLSDEEARRIAASVARYDARDPRVFLVTPRASNGLGLRVRAVRHD